jgi:hypothetical protein
MVLLYGWARGELPRIALENQLNGLRCRKLRTYIEQPDA